VGTDALATEGRGRWLVCAMTGLAGTVLYVQNISPELSMLAFGVIAVSGAWACFAGPRRFHTDPRWGRPLIGLAALCLLIGVVSPAWAVTGPAPLALLPDIATITGYVLIAAFLVGLLRARQRIELHTVLDELMVCLAGGMVSALLPGRPAVSAVLTAVYPVLDIALLLLVANLTFTASGYPPALLNWLGAFALMLAGDVTFAIIGLLTADPPPPIFEVPFLMAFTLLGIGALHPSMADVSRAERSPAPAWSWRRMLLIGPAVLSPFVMLAVTAERSRAHLLIIVGTGAVLTVLLLVRSVAAVRVQVAAQLHSEHQATHDPLTGLPNRLVAGLPAGSPERVWVYLIDLDGFQWVNESWGHDAGDQLVIDVATRLRGAVPRDAVVARVDGDEFLLTHVDDKPDALRLVDDIRGCFTRPLPVDDTEVTVSASIGIAHADGAGDPAMTAAALMRDADTAMRRAKAEGPGRSSVYDTSMHDQVRERIELTAALRTALAEDRLTMAFQPVVRTDTGQAIGAEALVGWEHPERGPIAPDTFMPIADESGMIGAFGSWVREEALRHLAAWRADRLVPSDFCLYVNVSPRELSDPEFPLEMASALARHGVPARSLALEMPESVVVDGSSVTARVLSELRELGVRLFVDDFGTGFSAIGHLRRFPITGVKINRTLVSGLGNSVEDEEIVRAVVAMSHALGLAIVAEGVETREQRDTLTGAGVARGQGWLWGAAEPADKFIATWRSGEAAGAIPAEVRDQV
jgi:diguanylate cyclase (GGDEF)-like protein